MTTTGTPLSATFASFAVPSSAAVSAGISAGAGGTSPSPFGAFLPGGGGMGGAAPTSSVTSFLTPPDLFGMVERGIYRSNPPHAQHFPFLSTLRLRTVLFLSADAPTRAFTAFLDEHGIQSVFILPESPAIPTAPSSSSTGALMGKRPVRGGATVVGGGVATLRLSQASQLDLAPITTDQPIEERMKQSLELVLNQNHHPILLVCTLGMHETGTVIGCLRKLQGWNLASILAEYRMFAGAKARLANEQWIEFFDLDLVSLPNGASLPAWFVDQRKLLEGEEEEFLEHGGKKD